MSYVVAQVGDSKAQLYKTRRSGDKLLGVVPDHTMYAGATPIVIHSKEILVSLGDAPALGKVYGVVIEPVEERLFLKGYGEIYNFVYKMAPEHKARVQKALQAALLRVKKLGPHCDWGWRTELRTPPGKVAKSTYAFKPKGDDVLTLRTFEGMNAREIAKVSAHEMAHGVWFRYMDATQRSRWIRLFDKYVSVNSVSVRDIKEMIRDMRQIDGIGPYMKDAEPEQQAAAVMYLGWLKKVHEITKRDAQDLLSSGADLPIPDTHIHRGDVQTPITLYSKKSAPELFAEAVSSHVVGDLSDKRIIAMLKELQG